MQLTNIINFSSSLMILVEGLKALILKKKLIQLINFFNYVFWVVVWLSLYIKIKILLKQ